ncbi:hypothetical protein MHK_003322 [Candidatus Magnetomorum sp. HK-1]|nr:hypothetical protein MHK_003322 [Candidatus Magnetomorum sp. HK-1]
MKAWKDRCIEEANLFNPAFICIISYQCIKGYCETAQGGTPYILPFVVTPLILHKNTRESLPKNVNAIVSSWITNIDHSHVRIGYPERIQSIVPYVKESLSFALINKLIEVDNDGSLYVNQNVKIPSTINHDTSGEVIGCYNRAFFCGRWFAKSGNIETILALLGVRP